MAIEIIRERVGRCHCGAEVDLDQGFGELRGFTNECDACGLLYNWAGQELNPPEYWEEPFEPEDY